MEPKTTLLPDPSIVSSLGDSAPKLPIKFRLTRHFSIASLLGVLVIVAVLILFYRYFAFSALEQHETRDNVNITQIFASTLWRKHADYVKSASTIPQADLQHRPEVDQIRADVLQQMKGLLVVKVKIYNLEGLTVFSTDPKQIGENKSTNSGFLAAKAGRSVSEITFRDRFDAFEQVINDRSLVSSYIPIRTTPAAPVEGVMEVYSDVTAYVESLQTTTWEIVAGVLASLAVLYLFLLSIVRRAEDLITAQAEEVRIASDALLRHNKLHDTLTGLPNRESFCERLSALVKSAGRIRQGQKCAALFVNIDGFKYINDLLGHVVGDRILLAITARLSQCLRESDDLARIGGDEFAIVLRDISGDRGVEHVVNTAERVRGAISDAPIVVDANELAVTVSVGIAIYPDDGADVVELMKNAAVALNHAKQIGRNQYQFHTQGMNARALEMLAVDQELRRALKEQQFLLHYQPQIEISTGHITGAEALIRWRHPERGMVSPALFIPIAEERGLIDRIGDWVLRETCRQNKEWQAEGLPLVAVAVNISALQFRQKDLAQGVARILRDCGPAPEYLELELTESAVMRDANKTILTLRELKAVGVQLSLDDFGTGYSSLSQLKHFPFDKLKIDQSFVRELASNPDDLALVTAIIAMGKALGLKVIAEGVETRAQWDILQSLGCEEVQGFFVSKPLPAADFARFVQERANRP
jgi:diguanylate cyclase (GGDEF)-like protein